MADSLSLKFIKAKFVSIYDSAGLYNLQDVISPKLAYIYCSSYRVTDFFKFFV